MHMNKAVKSKYQIQFNSLNKKLLTLLSGKLPFIWLFSVVLCYRDLNIFYTQ